MPIPTVDYLAVLVAAVAGFAFGAVWYMALGRAWMAALGKTEEEVQANSIPKVFVVAFLAQLVMAWLLAGLTDHMGARGSLADGLAVGFYAWLGFVMTTMVVNYGFQGQRRMLTVIDGGHWLGVLLIQALVIGLFA